VASGPVWLTPEPTLHQSWSDGFLGAGHPGPDQGRRAPYESGPAAQVL